MKRRTLITAATGLAGSLALPSGWAQSGAYPNRPIKVIVPHAPGSSPDVVARLIGDQLRQALGQPVIIDNRAGAGGLLGAKAAATYPLHLLSFHLHDFLFTRWLWLLLWLVRPCHCPCPIPPVGVCPSMASRAQGEASQDQLCQRTLLPRHRYRQHCHCPTHSVSVSVSAQIGQHEAACITITTITCSTCLCGHCEG